MKKLVLVFAMLFATLGMAQNLERSATATQKGNYMIGLSTSGLDFSTQKDGVTNFNAGLDVGGFVADRLALIGKVGYGSLHYGDVNMNDWTYGVGTRYYLAGVLPIQADWTGSTGSTVQPASSYLGTQIGYAWFAARNLSVEPTLRYSWSMDRDNYQDVFSGGVSVNVFF